MEKISTLLYVLDGFTKPFLAIFGDSDCERK